MFRSSLFQRGMVDDYFEALRKKMVSEIDGIPVAQIVQADAEQLADQFMGKYWAECPALGEDISYDEPPFSPGNDRLTVRVYVPISGDHELFHFTGGSAPVITQEVQVQPNHLVIPMAAERGRIAELPREVHALLGRIRDGLGPIQQKLQYFNPDLRRWAVRRIRERQHEHASHTRVLGELRQAGFTLRRRDDGSDRVIVPVKPKFIASPPPPPPLPPKGAPEPELPLSDYDEILNVIQAMAKVYERSPSVFREMEEEDLRTILLVGLNGVFKGSATGETFNGEGKSDILIRVGDHTIFIAECLFWDGPQHFRRKLTEQLFRYSTWRDSKLAAIVFNRKKDFSAVVQKMKEVAGGLENKLTELPYPVATGCRHRLRRADDAQKQVILTCLAFEVPS